MRKKNFKMGPGKYYFTIKSGQSNITIKRDTKEEAEHAFLNYQSIGKDCEWQGRWDGKTYHETTPPSQQAA